MGGLNEIIWNEILNDLPNLKHVLICNVWYPYDAQIEFLTRRLFICIPFSDPIIGRFLKITTTNTLNFLPFFDRYLASST